MRYDDAGRALGTHGNNLRYAALTGTLAIRWEGARRPTVWTVPPPEIEREEATRELARRYLHIFGPATPQGFAKWGAIGARIAVQTFDDLGAELLAVRTPSGDAWILARDEPGFREPPGLSAPARLLPSGDTYCLFWAAGRELLVPDAAQRAELWTPRVWPGAVLVGGEIVGTWRRAQANVSVDPWCKLTRAERDAVEAEARSLPLPGVEGEVAVRWSR